MNGMTFLGLVAAACGSLGYLPQVIKTWRSRSAADISCEMFALFMTSGVLWLAYGVALHDVAIIAANVTGLGLTLTILYFKRRYG
jgi:MtN3 and saliva related transmembrane protein